MAEHVKGNEQATKQSLIGPLFTLLGYDLTDPRQWLPEYRVDFGKDRSVKPIDWAFLQNGRPIFFVEAKEAGRKLAGFDEQLADYFAKAPEAKLGILTNGIQWRFFTDVVNENVMDKEPFKLAVARIETRNLTAAVVESWKPIVANAISEWAKQRALASVLDAQARISAPPEEPQAPKVETTQEELNAFATAQRLLGPERPIAYEDTVSYLKIHLLERRTAVFWRGPPRGGGRLGGGRRPALPGSRGRRASHPGRVAGRGGAAATAGSVAAPLA
ncbi:type I restriction endonuclease [Sorangium sp. So ce388]|uniref:type I restriction endonuclease n=1 Tax=Sorangium sp. So ce388 TaxID=3133309 RepID=UPI003F5C1B1B